MKKLYTTPYGSRLYGTQTATSDWDWKHLVLPDLGDMVAGRQIKNKFYSTGSDEMKNTSADTDTEFVPVQTFFRHFLEGQAYAAEVAFGLLNHSKIEGAELHDERLVPIVQDLVDKFLTSNVHAMVSYAYSQAQLYSDKGDRLQKLHDLKEFFLEASLHPEFGGTDKLSNLMTQPKLLAMSDKLVYVTEIPTAHDQMEPAIAVLEKMYPGSITVNEALKRVTNTINKYGKRANQAMENEGTDWKAVSHALRITGQAMDILSFGKIEMPFNSGPAAFLVKVKEGHFEWEAIKDLIEYNIGEIAKLQEHTKLPPLTGELRAQFEEWLTATMLNLYGVTNVAN